MQKPYFLPDYVSASIHRPACPQCGALTMLARIMPARVGFDLRRLLRTGEGVHWRAE
jgi:hypothetical protein